MKKIMSMCLVGLDLAVLMLFILGAAALFFGGIALFGFQCYWWLKTGSWSPISIVNGAAVLGIQWGWLYQPSDFIGAHKIIAAIPASLALCVSAIVPALAYGAFSESSPFREN